MRRILIIGAGQAGALLALGLQVRGYDVTLVSDRTPLEIRRGRVMSSQCLFGTALAIERELGLDWGGLCPPIDGVAFNVPDLRRPSTQAIGWRAALDEPAMSVDQRLKIPAWISDFAERGGRVLHARAGLSDVERWCGEHELVVVATGRGGLSQLFERDAARSPFHQPQRTVALTYVHGMAPDIGPSAVHFNLVPGVGEYFVFPALVAGGDCDVMVFEALPGGPMDGWAKVATPAEHLAHSRHLLKRFLPLEAERCRHVELTDALGTLVGAITPTVRHPLGRLPGGPVVLGMGDAVVLNDPITGQGANSAVRCARMYEEAIVEQGDRPFDEAFMQRAFDRWWWQHARHVTAWTHAMLAPTRPHALALMDAAATLPALARRLANGFDRPDDAAAILLTPEGAAAALADAGEVPSNA